MKNKNIKMITKSDILGGAIIPINKLNYLSMMSCLNKDTDIYLDVDGKVLRLMVSI